MENNKSDMGANGHSPDQEKARREALLVEYQAAQDSAQHHDNLVWEVTSIMWGASLILIGFILDKVHEADLRPLITVLSILGFFLTGVVWIFALQLNAVKRQKYARCKELETQLHLLQHTNLRYRGGSQRFLYGFIMILFMMAWVFVLLTVWDCR